ncbi:MAG: TrbI/VirB10 family protein [Alphaproteobacteria bacterium]|jgi:type IV secretion system protein VirB10
MFDNNDDGNNPLKKVDPISGDVEQSNLRSEKKDPTAPDKAFQSALNETAQGFSSVAASKNSKKIFATLFIVSVIAVGYITFKDIGFEEKREKTPAEKIQERSTSQKAERLIKDAQSTTETERPDITQSSSLPDAPPVQAPQAPSPPPPPTPSAPQPPTLPQIQSDSGAPLPPPIFQDTGTTQTVFARQENDDEKRKALEARRKASIIVMGGGESSLKDKVSDKDKDKDADKEKALKKDKSDFLGFGEGTLGESSLARTKFAQVKATHIGRLDNLIAQGKIIHAVLETAINTDLPGTLRAVISRDVYAENGKAILVPKGSRVIGNYEFQVKPGQTRVAVVWSRLIRPDGVDIALDSPGTDTLGRSGIQGFLDNKFLTRLTNAFMISYVLPLIGDRLFKVDKNQDITTTAAQNVQTGVTTTSTTATLKAQQLKESSDKFRDVTSKAIEESFSTKPTIYVDQGTEINIFVNRDVIFPAGYAINGASIMK